MEKTIYNLDYFESHDEPGDIYLKSIGFNFIGIEVYWRYGCDIENCNCAGSWSNGNSNEVAYYIHRPS